jgi:hypothetical protein
MIMAPTRALETFCAATEGARWLNDDQASADKNSLAVTKRREMTFQSVLSAIAPDVNSEEEDRSLQSFRSEESSS